MDHSHLVQTFDRVDEQIQDLERIISARGSMPLLETVEHAMGLIKQLIIAYIQDVGEKQAPAESEDILDVFKALVKGDPSWNTIRDNIRELVYYKNCITMDRSDALPPVPDKMAMRTLRHLYLFMRTRCIREGRLSD
jgi:hypothetical protein